MCASGRVHRASTSHVIRGTSSSRVRCTYASCEHIVPTPVMLYVASAHAVCAGPAPVDGAHRTSTCQVICGSSTYRVCWASASHGAHRTSASRILHSTGSSCTCRVSAYGGTHRVSANGGVPAPATECIAPASVVNTSRQRQPFLNWLPCTLGQWSSSSLQRLHGTSA